jgi:hypothetical protein
MTARAPVIVSVCGARTRTCTCGAVEERAWGERCIRLSEDEDDAPSHGSVGDASPDRGRLYGRTGTAFPFAEHPSSTVLV